MSIKEKSVIVIDGIGEVLFKPNVRGKRLSISVKPFAGVQVLVPNGYPIAKAVGFVHEKLDWIKKAINKVQVSEQRKTIFTENTDFRTRSFYLRIEKEQRDNVRLRLENGCLRVQYPTSLNVEDPLVQEAIRYGIEKALRIEAKRELPARLHQLALKENLTYNKVFVKNLKSCWGSCSRINNINLNLHLVRLPAHLTDYVLLHELAHTVEKNHGPRFWLFLDKLTGGRARHLAKEMKHYRPNIY